MASKYKRGEQIRSMDELTKQEFVIFYTGNFSRVYHKGWISGWSLRTAQNFLYNGRLFKVAKNE